MNIPVIHSPTRTSFAPSPFAERDAGGAAAAARRRRRRPRRWAPRRCGLAAALVLAATALLGGGVARAQPAASDTLFHQGKALMDEGRVPEACQKFAESLALARRGGTLLNLAVCREAEGQSATALRLFEEARALAAKDSRDDRIALAEQHLATLRAKVSSLTIRVPEAAAGLVVKLDDQDVPASDWGVARPIDPGAHAVVASAGPRRFQRHLSVGSTREELIVEVALSVPAPEAGHDVPAPAPASGAHAPGTAAPSATLATTPIAPPRALRVAGWAAVVLGGGALIAGAVIGVKALNDKCADPCPDPMARQRNDDHALPEAHLADVLVPAGLVAAAAGLYVLIRTPITPTATAADPTRLHAARAWRLLPSVRARGGGVGLEGVW
jgi:hypothetical protein